ncbi:MAG: hypothetical protein ACYDH5_12435 [Acidimicrobiales bacterium]
MSKPVSGSTLADPWPTTTIVFRGASSCSTMKAEASPSDPEAQAEAGVLGVACRVET